MLFCDVKPQPVGCDVGRDLWCREFRKFSKGGAIRISKTWQQRPGRSGDLHDSDGFCHGRKASPNSSESGQPALLNRRVGKPHHGGRKKTIHGAEGAGSGPCHTMYPGASNFR